MDLASWQKWLCWYSKWANQPRTHGDKPKTDAAVCEDEKTPYFCRAFCDGHGGCDGEDTVWSVKPVLQKATVLVKDVRLLDMMDTSSFIGVKEIPQHLITSHHVFEIRLPSFFQMFRLTLVSLGSPSLRVQNLCWAFLATGNDNSTWRGSEWHDTVYDASILLNVVLISCPNIANSSRGTPGITRYSASHTSIRHESWSWQCFSNWVRHDLLSSS